MAVKAILILCAQALLVKSTLAQCTSRAAVSDVGGFAGSLGLAGPALAAPYGLAGRVGLAYNGLGAGCAGSGLAYDGFGAGFGRGLGYDGIYAPAVEFTATSGGALPVSSASAIAPVGISVASDNVYEGALAVGGELPFVGTVAMGGVVPSAGAGAVNHACGNGRNAMISENAAFAPGATAYGPAAAIAPAGFGYGGYGSSALGYGGFGSSALGYGGFGSSALGYGAYGAGLSGIGCGCA